MQNSNFVIHSVLRSVQRNHVVYYGEISSTAVDALTEVKSLATGGYQRPRSPKRVRAYKEYLFDSDAIITPIILNGNGQWHFYSENDSNIGDLICGGKASIIDGQHRVGGLSLYTRETGHSLPIPFVCYESLSIDEEIRIFDKINSEQVGLPKSIISYIRRDQDEYDWLAYELAQDSVFTGIVSTDGKRKAGHIQLATLSKNLETLFDSKLTAISKEKKLMLAKTYWRTIKDMWPAEWDNHKDYKLRNTVAWVGLSLVGRSILDQCFKLNEGRLDTAMMKSMLKRIKDFDWSKDNDQLRYFGSGNAGGLGLSRELLRLVYHSDSQAV
jgi:DNA sulfur modification protein DndB